GGPSRGPPRAAPARGGPRLRRRPRRGRARARAQLTRPPSGAESGRAALSAGFGISVRAVKPGLDPALPVLLLRAEHIPHHGSLAVVLGRSGLPGPLVAGPVRRRSWVAHGPLLVRP